MSNAHSLGKPFTGRAMLIWLLTFFGVVIGVNMTMMRLAALTLPGTEVDSAYRASLAYQSEIESARAQSQLGWNVDVSVKRAATGRVQIQIVGRDRRNELLDGVTFTARLDRPASNRMDHVAFLPATGRGVYLADIVDVARGQWDLTVDGSRDGVRIFRSIHRVTLE